MSRLQLCMSRAPLLLVVAVLTLSANGCVGIAAQLMYLCGGNNTKALYDGLEGKRVAVICLTNSSSYGSGKEGDSLGRMVAVILKREVKKIQIVPHSEIENWRDTSNWDETDYRAVGRGVKADMVVAIDVSSLSYFDGQTLYKGRADYKVGVYDMSKEGEMVWDKSSPDFQYPRNGGVPVTEMSESKFQGMFLTVLAREIAKSFYGYDPVLDVATDSAGYE